MWGVKVTGISVTSSTKHPTGAGSPANLLVINACAPPDPKTASVVCPPAVFRN